MTGDAPLSLDFLVRVPTGSDGPLPLVIVMHGRGADANDLAEIAPLLDAGYRFVFPNAPKPFEPMPGMTFGYSWFDGWPPAGDSFTQSSDLLLRFIDEAVERFAPPSGKLAICGFSQGGMMALDAGFRTEKPLAGIVCMSGAVNENALPDLDAHRDRPVLIVHGTSDDMIPVIAARRTRRVLEDHGVGVEFHEFEMGHFVTPESLSVVADFLRRCFERH